MIGEEEKDRVKRQEGAVKNKYKRIVAIVWPVVRIKSTDGETVGEFTYQAHAILSLSLKPYTISSIQFYRFN